MDGFNHLGLYHALLDMRKCVKFKDGRLILVVILPNQFEVKVIVVHDFDWNENEIVFNVRTGWTTSSSQTIPVGSRVQLHNDYDGDLFREIK